MIFALHKVLKISACVIKTPEKAGDLSRYAGNREIWRLCKMQLFLLAKIDAFAVAFWENLKLLASLISP